MDVGNFILAGDSIEIRESSLLMQFLAAGDVFFWIRALEYYLKHVVMHCLVVGYTLLCVDSH